MQDALTNSARSMALKAAVAVGFLVLVLGHILWSQVTHAESNDFDTAMEAARLGKYDRAVEMWSKVIQRNPRSYAALVNRGTAFLRSGYVFKAVTDWHEARKWSPLFAYGVYSGDYLAQASGDTAMLNYASPLELDPDHVASVIMTGTMCLELGHRAMAAELYRKSVDLTRNPMLKSYLEHMADSLQESPKR